VRILRFYKDQANFIQVGDQAYFLHSTRDGAYVLIRARCPHRGGPLFLGDLLNGPRESIRCPWHDSVVLVQAMQKKAPAMVVNRSECRVIVEDSMGTSYVRWVRKLLNNRENGTDCHAQCA